MQKGLVVVILGVMIPGSAPVVLTIKTGIRQDMLWEEIHIDHLSSI
jgi:hypothetical protein